MSEVFEHLARCLVQDISVSVETALATITKPHVLFRPKLSLDGNKYLALYGANIQEGCAGFGDTPEAAMLDFDRNWCEGRVSAALAENVAEAVNAYPLLRADCYDLLTEVRRLQAALAAERATVARLREAQEAMRDAVGPYFRSSAVEYAAMLAASPFAAKEG